MTKQKSIKKNAFYSMLRAFSNICFPVISFPYISRILNPDGIGQINFANSFVDYFIMFAGLGITSYAGREAAKIRDNVEELNKLSKELIIINSISTVISYFFLFIVTISISKFSQYLILIGICSSKVLFETLGLNWLFIAEEDYKYITIRSIIFQIISLICMFLFVHTESDLIIYAIITVISSVGSNLFNIFYAKKYINIFNKTTIELKKHLRPTLIFFGVAIAGRIYASIDTLMLGFLSTDNSIGIYTAANKIIFMVQKVISAAVVVMMPKCAYLFVNNKIDEYKTLLKKGLEVSILLSLPAVTGLFILSKPLIIIFCGLNYSPAIVPMQILSVFILISALTNIAYSNVLIPIKKENIILIAQIIGLLINIILNFILIPLFDVKGAIISTITSEIITTLILVFASKKYLPIIDILQFIFKYLPFTIIMGTVTIFTYLQFNSHTLQLFACTLVGALTYVIILIVTKNHYIFQLFETIKKKIFR